MNEPFHNINQNDLETLLKLFECKEYSFKKNQFVLPNIRIHDQLGIVIDGEIHVVVPDESGSRTIVENLEAGSLFGSPFTSYIGQNIEMIAKKSSKIYLLDYQNILKYANENPAAFQFLKNILEISNDMISKRNLRIKILAQKTIRARLVAYFRVQIKNNPMGTFTLPFSFTDLADYLCVDRSAMTREIKMMKNEGILRINKKRITVIYR